MTADIINLNVKRAEKEGDCTLMSVSDCLEDALQESQDGRWTKSLMIFYRRNPDEEEGGFLIDMRCAGCSTLELRGLLISYLKEEILA